MISGGTEFNSLQPRVAYLHPLKTKTTQGFLMFSGSIGKQHQAVMGQSLCLKQNLINLNKT